MLKDCSQLMALLRGSGTFKRWDLVGVLRSLVVCLGRGLWDPDLFLSLPFTSLYLFYHVFPTVICFLTTGPKAMPIDNGLKPPKLSQTLSSL